jgi:hypothetical protein
MKISELSEGLRTIADEVTDDSGTRLASVVRRAQLARRSKVAGTVVTTAAVAAVVAFLPTWDRDPVADKPPVASGPGTLATVKDGDQLFYKDAGGTRLLGERVGERGDTSISVTVTPRVGNLGWTQPCQSTVAPALTYHLAVDGKDIPAGILDRLRYTGASGLSRTNATCDQPRQPLRAERSLSLSPTGNVAAWRSLGITPGISTTFTLSVTAADDPTGRAALARASLRLGIFELPRHPLHIHGIWLARHIVDPPGARGAFVLVRHDYVTVGPGTTPLSVSAPASDGELYVRSFAVHGQRSDVELTAGAGNPREIQTVQRTWSIASYLHAGPTTIRAGVAQVPPGDKRRIMIVVYSRYQ